MEKKEERFLIELDRRARLWERMRADAERRVKLDDMYTPLAKLDLEVAEKALERIAKKKAEVLKVDEKPKVDYTDPVEMKALQKRVRKKAKALYEETPVNDEGEVEANAA